LPATQEKPYNLYSTFTTIEKRKSTKVHVHTKRPGHDANLVLQSGAARVLWSAATAHYGSYRVHVESLSKKPAEKRHEACRVVWSCSNQVALSTKKLTHYMKALSYKRTLFKTQLLTNDRIPFAA